MRVLVTGGSGFLGSRLVERLTREGHDVAIARRADHDLTSMGDTARLFEETAPELVFHLAAEVGGIGANRANPGRYWYANLIMGAHVLEQARLHETPKLVIAGTICAYPKFAPVPFHEDDLWNGYPEETNAPYGVAKKTILVGAQAYREQYGTNAIFLLPVNLYGPGDNFDLETSHVIPALIRKMVEAHDRGDEEIVLWGDGTPTREFLYVDDCVEGLAVAAERYEDPAPVNLGHGRRDRDRRPRRARARDHGLRGCDPMGHVEAQRAAATPARHVEGRGALRLPGCGHAAGRARADGRLVPGDAESVNTAAAVARPNRALAALSRTVDAVARHVVVSLAVVIAFQVLATVALFFSVNHNGWLTYQGGDQIWLVTSGWLLGKGMIGYALTGHGWPMLLAPLTWITGSSSVQLLPADDSAPGWSARADCDARGLRHRRQARGSPRRRLVCRRIRRCAVRRDPLFRTALSRLVGRPVPAPGARADAAGRLPVGRRSARLRGVHRPRAPCGCLPRGGARRDVRRRRVGAQARQRAVPRRATRRLRARPPLGAPAAVRNALAPALLALTIWKSRGLGEVPLFAQSEAVRLAAGLGDPVLASATSWFDRTVRLDPDTWRENMSNIREFTWSARVIQFLPLAGAVAVARRSVPAAGLMLTWLLGYVVIKGAADVATVESGSFWRLVMPALPAFVLLDGGGPAARPHLRSTGSGRGSHPTPGAVRASTLPRPSSRSSPSSLSPSSCSRPSSTSSRIRTGLYVIPELVVDEIGVPADPDAVSLTVRRVGDANVLRWTDSTTRARTFYRVYRSSLSRGFSEMVCEARGSDRCDLRAETLVTTRDHTFVDRDPPADAIYRIGVAANWLDDETRGDVVAISPPVAPPASSG